MNSNFKHCVTVQITLSPGVDLPKTQTFGASGFDLTAYIDVDLPLLPGKFVLVPTGISMAIPEGYEAQIRPRSGLALNHGITCLNSPGTIDADYRGMLKVLLINHSEQEYVITKGMRIAQLVFAPVIHPKLEIVAQLPNTARGEQGFGHTGLD